MPDHTLSNGSRDKIDEFSSSSQLATEREEMGAPQVIQGPTPSLFLLFVLFLLGYAYRTVDSGSSSYIDVLYPGCKAEEEKTWLPIKDMTQILYISLLFINDRSQLVT